MNTIWSDFARMIYNVEVEVEGENGQSAAAAPTHTAGNASFSYSGGTLDDLSEHLDPTLIAQHLYTGGQPDPDLVIRTSGEQRLSDFMVWQSAHSEFYFVEALGPDLREVDFLRALRSYAQRQRRYGA